MGFFTNYRIYSFNLISHLNFIEYKIWRVDVLEHFLPPFTMIATMVMPLSQFLGSDRLLWRFNKNGLFLMKACYHKLYEENFEYGMNGASSNHIQAWFWRYLWKLKIPPKVKMFV